MVKVKINGKNYNVKEMEFAEYTKMEEQGFSILDAFRKKQMTLIAMGFVCAVVGCDRDEAEHLITQHVLVVETLLTSQTHLLMPLQNPIFSRRCSE